MAWQMRRTLFNFIMFVMLLAKISQAQLLQPDNRCFLQDGGSTLTFFIKEDLAVGEQIGRLNIQGRVGRDIDLTLEDVNSLYDQLPVQLEGKFSIFIHAFFACF